MTDSVNRSVNEAVNRAWSLHCRSREQGAGNKGAWFREFIQDQVQTSPRRISLLRFGFGESR